MGCFLKLLFKVSSYTTIPVGLLVSALFLLSFVFPNDPTSPVTGSWLSSFSQLGGDSMWTRAIWEPPPVGTKMPPSEMFRLTKEMVGHRAKDNVIIITFGNHAFTDLVLNWVRHLTDVNLSNLLVGAMDAQLLEALYWKGVPVFDMNTTAQTNAIDWGSSEFHKLGREKVFLLNVLLSFGYELLFCDTDVVWLKNPLPYFSRYPEADILAASDEYTPTVTDDSLEVWNEALASYNIGMFYWRPTNSSLKLAKEWKDLLLANDKLWDQVGFNDVVRRVLGPSAGDNGLVYAFDGSLKLGILPISIFCGGQPYFVQDIPRQLKLEPYATHNTLQFSGSLGKLYRFREAMIFYDPPQYYDSAGGFLSFRTNIPKRLLLDGDHTIETHFSLVNYQIKQIRTALAMASLLNRTLVMPPLWCRFDRMWFGHPGVLRATLTRQPFLCPMDHIFEIRNMVANLSEAEYGPAIDFREYSFLNNPLLPKQVKESKIEIRICDENSANCHTRSPGVIRLPRNSSEETILSVTSSYKDVKVLEFSSMQGIFSAGFADKGREEKFRRRVRRFTTLWCCLEQHSPGHIYYDMYWDEKPGWKAQPPQRGEDDHPPW